MKNLLATLLLTACTFTASGANAFLVIGDSLSAQRVSWPEQMRQQYGSWIRLDAQSMRALAFYELSPDHAALDAHQYLAVLALGFNDGSYYTAGYTTADEYVKKLSDTVNKLRLGLDRSYQKVMVVVPPHTPKSNKFHNEVRYAALIYCAVVEAYNIADVTCVDLNDIGYYDNTFDGVHPTNDFSRQIAEYMYGEILNFAPKALQ